MENLIEAIKKNHKGYKAELITKIAFFIANKMYTENYDMVAAYAVAKEYVD